MHPTSNIDAEDGPACSDGSRLGSAPRDWDSRATAVKFLEMRPGDPQMFGGFLMNFHDVSYFVEGFYDFSTFSEIKKDWPRKLCGHTGIMKSDSEFKKWKSWNVLIMDTTVYSWRVNIKLGTPLFIQVIT